MSINFFLFKVEIMLILLFEFVNKNLNTFYLNENNFTMMNKLLFLINTRDYFYKKKYFFALNNIFEISNIIDKNLFDFVKLYILCVKFEMKNLKTKMKKKFQKIFINC